MESSNPFLQLLTALLLSSSAPAQFDQRIGLEARTRTFNADAVNVYVAGTGIDEASLERIVAGALSLEELAALDVERIYVPRLSIEWFGGSPITEIDVLGLDIREVRNGSIGSITIRDLDVNYAGSEMSATDIRLQDLNWGAMFLARSERPSRVAPLGNLEINSLQLASRAQSCSADEISVSLTGQAFGTPLGELIPLLTSPGSDWDDPRLAAALRELAVILHTLEIGSRDVTCLEQDQRISLDYFHSVGSHVVAEGLSWASDLRGSVAIQRIKSEGFDLSRLSRALSSESGMLSTSLGRVLASWPGFSLEQVEVQLLAPSPNQSDVSFTLARAGVDLGSTGRSNVVTEVQATIEDLVIQLPAEGSDTTLPDLGYNEANLDLRAALTWDAASEAITIEDISLSGQDMGRIALNGTIFGVPESLMALDSSAFDEIVRTGGIGEIALRIEDNVLVSKIVDVITEEQSVDRTEFVKGLTESVSDWITDSFGNSKASTTLQKFSFGVLSGIQNVELLVAPIGRGAISFSDLRSIASDPALADEVMELQWRDLTAGLRTQARTWNKQAQN